MMLCIFSKIHLCRCVQCWRKLQGISILIPPTQLQDNEPTWTPVLYTSSDSPVEDPDSQLSDNIELSHVDSLVPDVIKEDYTHQDKEEARDGESSYLLDSLVT